MTDSNNDVLIEVIGLKTHFFTDEGVVKAIDGINFEIKRGHTLCIVGESGCGKSVTSHSILQIVQKPGRIVGGDILFHRPSGEVLNLVKMNPRGKEIRAIRGKEISMVFQEPMSSLGPIHTIGNQIMEVILLHLSVSKQEAKERTIALLNRVGIPKPEKRIESYTFELSGGMRQRAMIAMALACEPSLLIADEPTTALDVTTQANILDLIKALKEDLGTAIMYITHDLGVVAEIADEVAVMYLGTIVERGEVESIFIEPKHPYTKALLRSIPKLELRAGERLDSIKGMIPHPFRRPQGCSFHTRCDHRLPGICDRIIPPRKRLSDHQEVCCHLYGDVDQLRKGSEVKGEVSTTAIFPTPRYSEPNRPIDRIETLSPRNQSPQPAPQLLELKNLKMHFPIQRGLFRHTVGYVKAVEDISFTVHEGETMGLVGESGCGKTTVGRCILRVYNPTSGQVFYHHKNNGETVDLVKLSNRELKTYRRDIRLIFQDPYTSLNPRLPILEIVGEPLKVNKIAKGKELEDRVADLLQKVGLRPEYMCRYPHAFSGGERQAHRHRSLSYSQSEVYRS